MNYTGIKKSRSIPLLPQLKKHIAYQKLSRGKPVSKFTKETKKELKDKIYLVHEAKRLMELTTPCADNALENNLILDEVLEEIMLYDSNDSEIDASKIDASKIDASKIDASKIDASKIDAFDDNEIDDCDIKNSSVEKNEKGSSPIHIHLLDNELEFDSNPECNDSSSDTSDTEYNEVLSREDDNTIFPMDEELDIIDGDFQFIN